MIIIQVGGPDVLFVADTEDDRTAAYSAAVSTDDD
jgi:hypothetical protein